MQRPCAYCKENGHHIRNCAVLAAKNSRQGKAPAPVPVLALAPRLQVPAPAPAFVSKNIYANLCESSDDEVEDEVECEVECEVEEGEIVEDRKKTVSVSFITSPMEGPKESSGESDSSNERWTRSGIKVIPAIQTPQPQNSSESDDEGPGCDYEKLAQYMQEMSKYLEKYRGRSWADIECDSDVE